MSPTRKAGYRESRTAVSGSHTERTDSHEHPSFRWSRSGVPSRPERPAGQGLDESRWISSNTVRQTECWRTIRTVRAADTVRLSSIGLDTSSRSRRVTLGGRVSRQHLSRTTTDMTIPFHVRPTPDGGILLPRTSGFLASAYTQIRSDQWEDAGSRDAMDSDGVRPVQSSTCRRRQSTGAATGPWTLLGLSRSDERGRLALQGHERGRDRPRRHQRDPIDAEVLHRRTAEPLAVR